MTVLRLTQEAIESLSDGTPAARLSQEVVEILGNGTPAVRVTQEVVETLSNGTPAARVTQEVIEVLSGGAGANILLLTQEVVEALSDGTPALRLTQEAFEVVSTTADAINLLLTQEAVETVSNTDPPLLLTQVAVEYVATYPGTSFLLTQEAVEVASSTADATAVLLTQEAIEVLSRNYVIEEVTALYRFALTEIASDLRATTVYRLGLVELMADLRATSLIRLTLAEAVPCLTYWATMWRIERTDGEVFTFTSHDRDLDFRGETYRTCASLSAGASEQGAMLGDIGNMEIMGMITDDALKENELFAGMFDGAAIEVWLFPWSDAGGETPRRLMAGNTGNLSHRIGAFTAEVLTVSQLLGQKALVEIVTPSCRFELGDARCTVDLEALRLAGSVTDLAEVNAHNQANKRIFFDTSRTEDTGHWNLGTITFTSGDNTGISTEVKTYDQTTGEFVLWEPLLHIIAIGDAYTIVPGCDRLLTTCGSKFANLINFGGFPDLPGQDELAKTPNAGGGLP